MQFVVQILHDDNVYWTLHSHTSSDDLDEFKDYSGHEKDELQFRNKQLTSSKFVWLSSSSFSCQSLGSASVASPAAMCIWKMVTVSALGVIKDCGC